MVRLAAARHLDILARLLQRLQAKDMAKEEAERTGDVILESRRTEDAIGTEEPAHCGNDVRVAELSLEGAATAIVEALPGQSARVAQVALDDARQRKPNTLLGRGQGN